MSAEKEIVNYWYNKNGFFTLNNIKVSNRDFGILAIKYKKEKAHEVRHIDVSCSITSTALEKDSLSFIKKINREKFQNKKFLDKYLGVFPGIKKFKHVLILSNIPKSREKEIIKQFKEHEIKVIAFNTILAKVIEDIDTQYYKNNVIRTLQLLKYTVLNKPHNFELVSSLLSSGGKEEYLKTVLRDKGVIKKLSKTDEEVLKDLLKHASVKNPEKLAGLIQENILNRLTRKPFLDALLKLQGVRKEIKKELIRKEKSLKEFF